MADTDQEREGAELEDELTETEKRMAQIKAETTEELIRDWPSPWRNDAMTSAKVSGRLSSNKEYQVLLHRQRQLREILGVAPKQRENDEAQDPMGSYAMKIAKAAHEKRQ